jgi:hypothetical protein
MELGLRDYSVADPQAARRRRGIACQGRRPARIAADVTPELRWQRSDPSVLGCTKPAQKKSAIADRVT